MTCIKLRFNVRNLRLVLLGFKQRTFRCVNDISFDTENKIISIRKRHPLQ